MQGFVGEVIIEESDAALAHAQKEYSDPNPSKRMVFWTDGIIKGGNLQNRYKGLGGSGVAYKNANAAWTRRAFKYGYAIKMNVTKVYGICKALQIAKANIVEAEEGEERLDVVVIYSESVWALERLRNSRVRAKPQGSQHGIRASIMLGEMGVKVELRWVPAKSTLKGQILAQQAAKEAVRHSTVVDKFQIAEINLSRMKRFVKEGILIA